MVVVHTGIGGEREGLSLGSVVELGVFVGSIGGIG